MSSDDQSDIDQSGIDQSPPLSSSVPGKERHIERVLNNRGLRTFLVVDHTANLRKNTKVSGIWHHGGERRRLDDDSVVGVLVVEEWGGDRGSDRMFYCP